MSNDKFNGYYLRLSYLLNKDTKVYNPAYMLYDNNKLVGIFEDDTFANRYWVRTYIPSGRTKIKVNEIYELGGGTSSENQHQS